MLVVTSDKNIGFFPMIANIQAAIDAHRALEPGAKDWYQAGFVHNMPDCDDWKRIPHDQFTDGIMNGSLLPIWAKVSQPTGSGNWTNRSQTYFKFVPLSNADMRFEHSNITTVRNNFAPFKLDGAEPSKVCQTITLGLDSGYPVTMQWKPAANSTMTFATYRLVGAVPAQCPGMTVLEHVQGSGGYETKTAYLIPKYFTFDQAWEMVETSQCTVFSESSFSSVRDKWAEVKDAVKQYHKDRFDALGLTHLKEYYHLQIDVVDITTQQWRFGFARPVSDHPANRSSEMFMVKNGLTNEAFQFVGLPGNYTQAALPDNLIPGTDDRAQEFLRVFLRPFQSDEGDIDYMGYIAQRATGVKTMRTLFSLQQAALPDVQEGTGYVGPNGTWLDANGAEIPEPTGDFYADDIADQCFANCLRYTSFAGDVGNTARRAMRDQL